MRAGHTRGTGAAGRVRTFRGPGNDVGGGFDGDPVPDAQEEGPPPLGVTPEPKGRP